MLRDFQIKGMKTQGVMPKDEGPFWDIAGVLRNLFPLHRAGLGRPQALGPQVSVEQSVAVVGA